MSSHRSKPVRLIAAAAALVVLPVCGQDNEHVREATPVAELAVFPRDRVRARIDNSRTVLLRGHTAVEATPENDLGRVNSAMPMERLILVLRRSDEQQISLDSFSAALQDRLSPAYHQWLTPEEFGRHFGLSDTDLNRLATWLRGFGFTVDDIPTGHWTITFSGTVTQVETAFHTPIHWYKVAGELRYANASDPSIPDALSGVVADIAGLNNIPDHHVVGNEVRAGLTKSGLHFLDPADFMEIYDLNVLYKRGITGQGVKIAVVEPCTTNIAPAAQFWTLEGLSQNSAGSQNYGTPPACSVDRSNETLLDYEWSGAVAPRAQIWVVSSDASDALLGAVQGVVENSFAPIVSLSYSRCESAADQRWINLWQQAHTEGITGVVSSGDSGAAGCDPHEAIVATHGQAVNGLCASSYVVCVGGTQFDDLSDPGKYWSTQGAPLGYIPEVAWNETGPVGRTIGTASGGGFSTQEGRPSWQTENHTAGRGIPDVALTAASHDAYRYCNSNDPCEPRTAVLTSGTSAAAPSFAGIMALIVQATGQRQGSANQTLYALAGQNIPGIFHDVVAGNNSVPGVQGFSAAPGWDPVTGLGSVDVTALATHWPGFAPPAPAINNLLMTTAAPPATGCSTPPATSALLTTDGTAYLYFTAEVTTADHLMSDWLAPNGDVLTGGSWSPASGNFCFPDAQLGLSGMPAAHLGKWQARIYDNGGQIASLAFAVSAPASGIVLLHDLVSDTTGIVNNTCVVPASVSNFVPTSTRAYVYFDVNGSKAGDSVAIRVFRPDGVLFTTINNTVSQPGSNGYQCFSDSVAISGEPPALYTGGWTVQAYWNGSDAALFTLRFAINATVRFGYAFPHLAFGGGYQTTLTYVNHSQQTESCLLRFYGDAGAPLSVPFADGAATSRMDTLLPGGTVHVQTHARGATVAGWAEAQCTSNIKASILYRLYSSQGAPRGEASVNATALAMPQFASFAQTATGLALANPSSAAVTATVTALDANGGQLGSTAVTLGPNAHTAFNIGPRLGIGTFSGSVRVSATNGIYVLALNAEAFPVFSSLPPAEVDRPSQTSVFDYYFPHLAFGGGYQTTLTYVNYLNQPVTCTTNFYTDSGSSLSVPFPGISAVTRADDLAPGATVHVQTTASGGTVAGWAHAECSGPVKASVLYRLYDIHGTPQGEASVNASENPDTSFVSFAETATGLAVANPSANSVVVTISALDSGGALLGIRTITLSSNGHTAFNIGPLLGIGDFSGSVRVVSTAPIISLALNAEAFPVFSSLPPGDL